MWHTVWYYGPTVRAVRALALKVFLKKGECFTASRYSPPDTTLAMTPALNPENRDSSAGMKGQASWTQHGWCGRRNG